MIGTMRFAISHPGISGEEIVEVEMPLDRIARFLGELSSADADEDGNVRWENIEGIFTEYLDEETQAQLAASMVIMSIEGGDQG